MAGLTDDGMFDEQNPNPTHMILYESAAGRRSTLWVHEHGTGKATRHWGDRLTAEGVDDPRIVTRDAGTRRFVLAHVRSSEVQYDDLLWTNTIIATSAHLPHATDLSRFMEVNDNFLRSLDASEGRDLDDALFITSARNKGEDLVTVYLRSRSKPGAWMAMLRNATLQPAATQEYITAQLKKLPAGGRVYVYGDETKLDLVRLADKQQIDVVRRSGDVVKSFGQTNEQLAELAADPPHPDTTTFVNGLPGTADEVAAMGKPADEAQLWEAVRSKTEDALRGRYSSRVDTRDAFLRELTEGDNDAVVIIAHSEGEQIFVRGESVTFKEIAELPDRQAYSRRPRRAILVSCEGANLGAEKRRLLRGRLESLATILTRKNFFDEVIAPTRVISPDEGLTFLQQLLDGATLATVRKAQDFWRKVAAIRSMGGGNA